MWMVKEKMQISITANRQAAGQPRFEIIREAKKIKRTKGKQHKEKKKKENNKKKQQRLQSLQIS